MESRKKELRPLFPLMARRTKTSMCVYCVAEPASTDDHIPPRCLFPSPKPSNAIKVPCCKECNSRFSRDDVYFRDCLSLWQETSNHPAMREVAEAMLRSFKKQKQEPYTRSLLKKVIDVDMVTKGGIYTGKANALKIDSKRIAGVVGRIVRGLFFHEYGEILCPVHQAVAMPLVEEHFQDADQRKSILGICDHLRSTPRTTLGQGVFSYWHHRYDDDPYKSLWLLLFYEKMAFLGLTPAGTSLPQVFPAETNAAKVIRVPIGDQHCR
jgi:hypothetical protein